MRGRGEAPTVGRPRHAADGTPVAFQVEDDLPYGDIPELDCPVPRGAGETLPVTRPAEALDQISVSLEGEKLLSSVGVPHLYRAWPVKRWATAGGEVLRVGRPDDRLNPTR